MEQEVTVRELGGAMYAELDERIQDRQHPAGHLQVDLLPWMIDIMMGVVARYDQFLIVNDEDLPVEPIERYFEIKQREQAQEHS